MSYYINIELPFRRDNITEEQFFELINKQEIINVCEEKRTTFNLNYQNVDFPSQQEAIESCDQISYFDKDGQEIKIQKQFNFYKPQQLIFERSILQSIEKLPNGSLKVFSQSLPQKIVKQKQIQTPVVRNEVLDDLFTEIIQNKQAISKQLLIRMLSLEYKSQKYNDVKLWLRQQSQPIKNPFKNLIRRDNTTQIQNIGYLVPWIRVDNYYKNTIKQLLQSDTAIQYLQKYKNINKDIKLLFYKGKLLSLLSYMNYDCLQEQLQQNKDSLENDDILLTQYKKIIQQFNDKYFKNLIQILQGNEGQDYKYLCLNGCEGKQLTSYKDIVTQTNFISQQYEEYEEYDEE